MRSVTEGRNLADAKLDDYLQRLDQSDVTENGTVGSRVKNLVPYVVDSAADL